MYCIDTFFPPTIRLNGEAEAEELTELLVMT